MEDFNYQHIPTFTQTKIPSFVGIHIPPWVAYHRHHGSTQLWSVLLLGITWSNAPFTHALFVRWRDKSCWTKFSLFVLIQIIDGWWINSYFLLNIVYKKHHVYVNLVIAIEKKHYLTLSGWWFQPINFKVNRKSDHHVVWLDYFGFPWFHCYSIVCEGTNFEESPLTFHGETPLRQETPPRSPTSLAPAPWSEAPVSMGVPQNLWMVYFMENPVKMI